MAFPVLSLFSSLVSCVLLLGWDVQHGFSISVLVSVVMAGCHCPAAMYLLVFVLPFSMAATEHHLSKVLASLSGTCCGILL